MAKKKELIPMVNWVYDLILWGMSVLVDLFFREVHPRGSWKIPRRGPVIFVAAPHANQFVDPLILMRVIKMEAGRRIAWLIAEKSMRRKFIGAMARAAGAVSVGRALDSTKPGTGTIYLPDPTNDPSLIRGVGSQFEKECRIGGLLVLPSVNGTAANAEILEIHNNEEIRLKKEFKGDVAVGQLTGKREENGDIHAANGEAEKALDFQGTKYKTAPKVDQSKVYNAVFERLQAGGCVGIFPEGGSHDRTELLPLKAGVAIMALGSLAANPESGLKIVPCGMNYFHAHKFRSRAVVEFGPPIEVPTELVEMYKGGERREATRQLLETVYQSLVAVTVTSPDYDTLMLIQAARRLYNPKGKKLPLPMIVELNRRLVKGYTQKKEEPRIKNLKQSVNDYNKQLWLLGVRDHQVEYAKFSIIQVVFTLIYRLGKLAVLSIGTLPGLILFAPVFIVTKIISIKKSREALAASTVKLQGRDVMATWKLLVAMAFAPTLYATYTALLTWWTYRNRVQGYMPDWVPLWLVIAFGVVFFPSVTFAALRIGETGMDIVKSLRPLVLSLNPTSANTLSKLREKRDLLSKEVTDVINTYGPQMYPDFDSARIVADPFRDGILQEPQSPNRLSRTYSIGSNAETPPLTNDNSSNASIGGGSSVQGYLPRNESLHDLGNVGLFASRPPSRSRSRSSSSGGLAGSRGFPVKGFSTISSKETLDEVSQKIRGAMRQRGKERRRRSGDGSGNWDFSDSGTGSVTPDSVNEMKKEM
ncbi:Glycerol-3-phosphate/dihydroxyacetone phosphate acyltransferase [Lecanora helva]